VGEGSEGVRIGKYVVLRRLAAGGMGEVFLARVEGPAGFEKTLVLKRVLKRLRDDPHFINMFLNEARLAAQLSHPNIVQIFELVDLDGTWVITMEFVDGLSARSLLLAVKQGLVSVSPGLACYICAQILQGLNYAHLLRDGKGRVRGVVHRDVSPENILLGVNGAVKLTDFGVARAAEAAIDLKPIGKIAYMAPEQRLGGLIDARADVYAAGVVLSELLTGGPFDGMKGLPQLADPELNAILGHALAVHPDHRYLSAADMSHALDGYLRSLHGVTANALGELVRTAAVKLEGQKTLASPSLLTMPGKLEDHHRAHLSSVPEALPEDVVALRTDPPHEAKVQARPLKDRGLTVPLSSEAVAAIRPSNLRRVAPLVALILVGAAGLVMWRTVSGRTAEVVREEPANGPLVGDDGDFEWPVPAPPLVQVPSGAVEAGDDEPIGPNEKALFADRVTSSKPPHVAPPVKKAEVARMGTVQVRVHPWAEVYWGEKNLGTTPFAPVALPVGRQVLTLRNRELNVTRQVVVMVKSDAEVSVFENFLR
jgi:eukaryotic-like serine/threonine-protein kinase